MRCDTLEIRNPKIQAALDSRRRRASHIRNRARYRNVLAAPWEIVAKCDGKCDKKKKKLMVCGSPKATT
jgi:hypothetical protein